MILDNPTNYATVLVELRAEKNLSQTELADKLGVSQRMISAIERKARQPSRIVRHKIHKVLHDYGLTVAHFLNKYDPNIRDRIVLLVHKYGGGCDNVAAVMGVDVEDVLAWTRGTKTLEGVAFEKMCDIFKVSPEWLDDVADDPDTDDTPLTQEPSTPSALSVFTPTGGRRIKMVEEQIRVYGDKITKLEQMVKSQQETISAMFAKIDNLTSGAKSAKPGTAGSLAMAGVHRGG